MKPIEEIKLKLASTLDELEAYRLNKLKELRTQRLKSLGIIILGALAGLLLAKVLVYLMGITALFLGLLLFGQICYYQIIQNKKTNRACLKLLRESPRSDVRDVPLRSCVFFLI